MLLPEKEWVFADRGWKSIQACVEKTCSTPGLLRGFEYAQEKFHSLGVNKKKRSASEDINYTRLRTLYKCFLVEYEDRKGRVDDDPVLFLRNIIGLVREHGVGYNGRLYL